MNKANNDEKNCVNAAEVLPMRELYAEPKSEENRAAFCPVVSTLYGSVKELYLEVADRIKRLIKEIFSHLPTERIYEKSSKSANIVNEQFSESETMSIIDELAFQRPNSLLLTEGQKKICDDLSKKKNPAITAEIREGLKVLAERLSQPTELKELSERERLAYDTILFVQITEHIKNLPVDKERDEQYNEKGIDYLQAYISELLSKSLCKFSPSLLEKKVLYIPRKGVDGSHQLTPYTIHCKMMMEDDLPYLVIKPNAERSEAPTWLVFPGTDFCVVDDEGRPRKQALSSVLADIIDEKGIAHAPAKHSIDAIVQSVKETKKSLIITGHSLGGELAQYVAVKLEKEQKLQQLPPTKVFAFNAPGVKKSTKESYLKIAEERRPLIKAFNTAGDFIPSGGYCLIGDHYGLLPVIKLDPGKAHCLANLNKKHKMKKIDTEQEEKKPMRKAINGFKKEIVSPLALKVLKCVQKREVAEREFMQPWLGAIPKWVADGKGNKADKAPTT